MRLMINHTSSFSFSEPMRYVVQSHRLQPSLSDGQSVIDWSVVVEGASFGSFHTDGAGDQLRTMSLEGPVSELAIVVTGVIEAKDMSGLLSGHRERISPRVYLRKTNVTKPDAALIELSQKAVSQSDGTLLDTAHKLSEAVADAISYSAGATGANTTAAEALALGQGVCQDHAHALSAVARYAGLPARYVTGYLNATDDLSAGDASHAWAEIFVEGLGWIGFDPANHCCPNGHYVRIGSGLDALHAAPIRGVTLGPGSEDLMVSVAVDVAQQ